MKANDFNLIEKFNTRYTFRYMDDIAFLDNVHFRTMFYIFNHTTSRPA